MKSTWTVIQSIHPFRFIFYFKKYISSTLYFFIVIDVKRKGKLSFHFAFENQLKILKRRKKNIKCPYGRINKSFSSLWGKRNNFYIEWYLWNFINFMNYFFKKKNRLKYGKLIFSFSKLYLWEINLIQFDLFFIYTRMLWIVSTTWMHRWCCLWHHIIFLVQKIM